MLQGVYVAGSSAEIERARGWMQKLRERGVHVSSTWPEVVAAEGGQANPRDATVEQRKGWSLTDIKQATGSQVFWLLMPQGPHSFGAAFEYGFFVALCPDGKATHVVSGDHLRTIFTAFSLCYDSDEEAFEVICKMFEPVVEKPENENAAQPEG